MTNATNTAAQPKKYELNDAVNRVKAASEATKRKFEESIDVAIVIGWNTIKFPIRGFCELPHGLGKKMSIAVICSEDEADTWKEQGADFAGEDSLIAELKAQNITPDVIICHTDLMKKVTPLARILGPKGLMPNAKDGTVSTDISASLKKVRAGQAKIKPDKAGVIHTSIGRVSFEEDKLVGNITELLKKVKSLRPDAAKGNTIKSMHISSTMGQGVGVDIGKLTY